MMKSVKHYEKFIGVGKINILWVHLNRAGEVGRQVWQVAPETSLRGVQVKQVQKQLARPQFPTVQPWGKTRAKAKKTETPKISVAEVYMVLW